MSFSLSLSLCLFFPEVKVQDYYVYVRSNHTHFRDDAEFREEQTRETQEPFRG